KAKYERSLELLRRAKAMDPTVLTKTGIMVGLGETREEIEQVMRDVHAAGVDIMTIGQYLRPCIKHLPVERYYRPEEGAGAERIGEGIGTPLVEAGPVERYYRPEEFEELKRIGEAIGIPHVEAGPLVRSSYHAHEQVRKLGGVQV